MLRILGFVIGYFAGCINFAYLIGKFKEHIDIRDFGSGNSGTTNAIRVMGWKLGMVTFFGDFFKCLLAYSLVSFIFKSELAGLYAGFGAVIGHNWPVFLKFRGGKGIAASTGLLFAVNPLGGLIIVIIVSVVINVTKYVSLGSLVLATLMPIMFFIVKDGQIEFVLLGSILMVIAFWRHKANIKRLIEGKENKLGSRKG